MKGICFTGWLQERIITGNKTETRRIMDPQPDGFLCNNHSGKITLSNSLRVDPIFQSKLIRPRYTVGEIVYVKEPYAELDGSIRYKRGLGADAIEPSRWNNSQSMPERLARYFLRITSVHGERLRDITEEAAMREGVQQIADRPGMFTHYSIQLHYTKEDLTGYTPFCKNARESFRTIIESIYGKNPWINNAYVWVYGFELVHELKPEERLFYKLTER